MLLLLSAIPLRAQASTNELSALAPPHGVIPPTFWEQHGTAILLGGIPLVALAVAALWKVLQPKPAVIVPPAVLAREALTKLLRQPEDGKLLSEVSQILRRYVVAAFELPPAEMTTAEFCAALAGNGKIGTEPAESISDFLRACDKDKFAARKDAPPLNAAGRALGFVTQIESEIRGQNVRTSEK